MGVIGTNEAENASYHFIAPLFESKIASWKAAAGNY